MQAQPVQQSTSIEQEFEFSQADFSSLAKLVYERSGIVLGDHKKNMVYARLAKRLRQLNMTNFGEYLHTLKGDDETEIEQFINAITTNLTRFFREDHHFDHIRNTLVPELVQMTKTKIKMWSAACASGPEPYSLAMTAHDALPKSGQYKLKILATDLDTSMLQTARTGIYDSAVHKDIPVGLRNKYTTLLEKNRATFEINQNIKSLIAFNRMNLMKEWPFKGEFDAIFCRNVLIYFNQEDKKRIIGQLIEKLRPGGYLYMGHAESIMNAPPSIKNVGPTTYQRVQ